MVDSLPKAIVAIMCKCKCVLLACYERLSYVNNCASKEFQYGVAIDDVIKKAVFVGRH